MDLPAQKSPSIHHNSLEDIILDTPHFPNFIVTLNLDNIVAAAPTYTKQTNFPC